MGGISTGTGIFSGINTGQIISQLLAIESRPKLLVQRRVAQLQQQQAAYLDLNSRIQALKTAAGAFRTNNVFKGHSAASSNAEVLSAVASTSATPGSYQFVVDRLVSTQQMLSRGFANANVSGLNAGTFTFESAAGRLDRDTALADLNGGAGVRRGKIVITDATSNRTATVDLSRVATVGEVLTAINEAGIGVSASVEGGRLIVRSDEGGNISITNALGSTTATSLGIERAAASSATVTGSTVYSLGADSALSLLNDGNGIMVNNQVGNARYDFQIVVGGTSVSINVGNKYDAQNTLTESAPTSIGGVIARINEALQAKLGNADARVQVSADGVRLEIVDPQGRSIEVLEHANAGSTTAADLGLLTSGPQTGHVQGRRILSGLNTTLAGNLNGGNGIAGNGVISITARNGLEYTVNVDSNGTVDDIIRAFNSHPSGLFSASLNRTGSGLVVNDLTGGSGNLIITGESAKSLGIETEPAGVASSSVDSGSLQHRYITSGTLLSSLRNNQGIGTGQFRITDSTGGTALVTIDDKDRNLDDLIRKINSRPTRIKARINENGDGLELYEDEAGAGSLKIKVQDETGQVAANLNIKGEAAGTGLQNVIDGSYERKITFDPGDTLQTIASKISAAGVGVQATIINDGTGSTPFRLSLSARGSGSAGRFIIDTGNFDAGLTQLDAGNDARIFYGSTDPAQGILLTSSRNTLDNVIAGVTIDLKSPSPNPVTLTVSRDTAGIETAVNAFVEAFNGLIDRINQQTRYNKDTEAKGPLLGDSTTLAIRAAMYTTVQGKPKNVSSSFNGFADVGITVGSGGKLQLNRDRLRAALEQDPQGVANLIAARELAPSGPQPIPGVPGATVNNPNANQEYLSAGLATLVENLSDSYINSVGGILTRRNQVVTDQIALQNRRIAAMDAQLAIRRQVLERQFTSMEQAIGQLQAQQGALSQLTMLG